MVENGLAEATQRWLSAHYPEARLIGSRGNVGYGAGANRGIAEARGRYVMLLNPDTRVAPGALSEMLRVLRWKPRAFITPKLLMPDGSVNACGNRMHYTGVTTCEGLGEPGSAHTGIEYPQLLSGAAIVASRSAWTEVGGFDELFFMYMEDADLSMRAQLLGYEIICAANAVVTHDYMLGMSAQKLFQLERNRLMMVAKSFRSVTLMRLAAALAFTEIVTWTYASLRGPKFVLARARSYASLWQTRRHWMASRKRIQASRRLADHALLRGTHSALPLGQLVPSGPIGRILAGLVTAVYLWLRPRELRPSNQPTSQPPSEQTQLFERISASLLPGERNISAACRR